MKTNLLITILAALLVSACATAPEVATPPETTTATPQETSTGSEQLGAPAQAIPEVQSSQLRETERNLLREMQKKSVYFDFNEFTIKPEYREVIQQQADFMKAHGNTVTLEGNSDERGSSEFNLALGSKRANSVRKALEFLGVPSSQIKSVSFGEEKPKLSCHEEKCWQENRRVDFSGTLD